MDNEQLSFFDEVQEIQESLPESEPQECPYLNDRKYHWWSMKNTHLCDEAHDCSHCHITDRFALSWENQIQKRCNVHTCTECESEYQGGKFYHRCKITGNKWTTGVWSYYEDYNKDPINSPCKFCDLVSCNNCAFRQEVSDDNPYGCCGSCANRLYCPESKAKQKEITKDEFISLAKIDVEDSGDMFSIDLSKGKCKSTYQCECSNYNGYISCTKDSYIKCACTEQKIKTDIFRAICTKDYEYCPLNKE